MAFSDEELALIDAIHAEPRWTKHRDAYSQWCKGHNLHDLGDLIHIQCVEPTFELSTRGGIHLVTERRQLTSVDLLRGQGDPASEPALSLRALSSDRTYRCNQSWASGLSTRA